MHVQLLTTHHQQQQHITGAAPNQLPFQNRQSVPTSAPLQTPCSGPKLSHCPPPLPSPSNLSTMCSCVAERSVLVGPALLEARDISGLTVKRPYDRVGAGSREGEGGQGEEEGVRGGGGT